ncbi:hypothetical protein PanWU01x14_186380, partial [Parasponia andersonii]
RLGRRVKKGGGQGGYGEEEKEKVKEKRRREAKEGEEVSLSGLCEQLGESSLVGERRFAW